MAPVAGRPFLTYLLEQCRQQGVPEVILSVGYKWEAIQQYFGSSYHGMPLHYAVETDPLGTGGALRLAMQQAAADDYLVLNGDSFFDVSLQALSLFHASHRSVLTLALKEMTDFERYGKVETDLQGRILSFHEKGPCASGLINTGIYVVNRRWLQGQPLPERFSFEQDLMEKGVDQFPFFAQPQSGYFIDIGIPHDYARAKEEMGRFMLPPPLGRVAKLPGWTLFLDRDGVINEKLEGDYVRNLDSFTWKEGALDALAKLSRVFHRVVVVTNQQGIGKQLMTEEDLGTIHRHLLQKVAGAGGRIDAIYHAPQLAAEKSERRKPGTGMALEAQRDFPDIRFEESVMVGDSQGDMEFGSRLGMVNIFLGKREDTHPGSVISCSSLRELARWMEPYKT